jgi:Flp pilus assembly protein TadG
MTVKRRVRNAKGAHIAEFAAVLMFGLPLLTLLVYVTLEIARFYTIKSAMEVGARNAARALVVKYNVSNTKATDVTFLTMPRYIANQNQFEVTWDSQTVPRYVTVSCKYPSDGSYGLQPFPAGPLRYLSNNDSFDLGNFTVRGSFTMPVQ